MLGVDATDSNQVAIKVFKPNPNTGLLDHGIKAVYQNEARAMQKLAGQENVVRMIDHGRGCVEEDGAKEQVYYIVMEYLPNGVLLDIITKADRFTEPIARTYFKQILTAMKSFHDNGLAHRDLKPENLMIDQNYNLKLIDFGLSVPLDNEEKHQKKLGTTGYQAPE